MGIPCTKPADAGSAQEVNAVRLISEPVLLHLYDLGTDGSGQALNTVLRPLEFGAFHCGVEIYSLEWSYSFAVCGDEVVQGTGLFCCRPRECSGHTYIQTVPMGCTRTTEDNVLRLIRSLEEDWTVDGYDILAKNCCHFANELCIRLGVGPLPEWVTNLPRISRDLAERKTAAAGALCCRAEGKSTCAPATGSGPPTSGAALIAQMTAFCCGSGSGLASGLAGGAFQTGAEGETFIETKPVRAASKARVPGCDVRMPRAQELRT